MSEAETPDEIRPDAADSSDHIFQTARAGGFIGAGQFFELGSRFFIALLLARWLGVNNYGLYVLAISIAIIFSGVSLLGLDRAMIRYVAILVRRNDRRGLIGTLQIGLGVSTVAGFLLGFALYALAAPLAGGLFGEPSLTPLLRLMALVVPFLTMSTVLVGVSHGFKRMEYSAFAENVIQTLVRLMLLVLLTLVGRLNLVAALIIYGISDVAATFTLLILLRAHWNRNQSGSDETPRRDVREIFSFAFPLWLSRLFSRLRNNIATLLLGSLSVLSSVGIYSVTSKINLVGHVSYLAIVGGVRPTLASLHDAGDRRSLANVYAVATRWTLTINLPFFLVIAIFPADLLGIFGEDFKAGAAALVILASAELVNAATGVSQSMIDMTGHTRVKLFNSFLWMVLAVGASLLLIPRFGVTGAAISAFTAIVTVNVLSVIQVRFLEGLMPFDRRSLKPLLAGVAGLLAGLAVRVTLRSAGAPVLVLIGGMSVFLAYGAAILLLGVEDEDRKVSASMRQRISTTVRWKLESESES